ncbi:hypothetical protein POM88_005629 [Heracleum sosnowskyi]|uniref:Uncharacterized protein n=1 Tax=Heracleum sosnowskyi TaxID=360622 RepID=A0AAD8J1V1_9APIA|nr:hypothetical protein POM88_005629 [Heracleum sosnowskyi]
MSSGGRHGRTTAASASQSLSSSSSAVRHHLISRGNSRFLNVFVLHKFFRKLAYHRGNKHRTRWTSWRLIGNFGSNSGSMQLPVQPRSREEAQNRSHGFDQQMLQQAYSQYHSAQQKGAPGMQCQHPNKIGMVGPSVQDHDMRMANIQMQDLMSI